MSSGHLVAFSSHGGLPVIVQICMLEPSKFTCKLRITDAIGTFDLVFMAETQYTLQNWPADMCYKRSWTNQCSCYAVLLG